MGFELWGVEYLTQGRYSVLKIFIDSEKDTWNICPIALENAIVNRIEKGGKPKAIIVVHLYGGAAKMDEILAISKNENMITETEFKDLSSKDLVNKRMDKYSSMGVFNG
mgnify:CR=1 FL=1